MSRTLTHALIILAVVLIASALATRGFALILQHLGYASFLPFALATASAINNQKGLLLTTLAVTILAIIPCTIQLLATALVPIGAGVLIGVAVQRAMTQSQGATSE